MGKAWTAAMLGVLLASGVSWAQQTPQEKALKLIESARVLVESEDYEGALRLFQRAYEMEPSTVTLYNMARMLDRLGRWREARETYERFIEAESDPERRRKGEERLSEMLGRMPGRVIVETSVQDAKVLLDGEERGPAGPWGIEVGPGRHRVEVLDKRYQPWSQEIEVGAGEEVRILVTLVPKTGAVVLRGLPMGAEVRIDGGAAQPARKDGRWEMAVGAHRIEVTAPGYLPWSRGVEVEGGREQEEVVRMEPLVPEVVGGGGSGREREGMAGNVEAVPVVVEPVRKAVSGAPWGMVGSGAALVVIGGILTALAEKERDKVRDAATWPDGTLQMTVKQAKVIQDRANRESQAAGALYGIGGVAVGVGLIWGVVDVVRSGGREAAGRGVGLSGGIVAGGALVGVDGRF